MPTLREPIANGLYYIAALAAACGIAGAAAAPREFVYRTAAGDTLIGLAARFMADPADWKLLQKRNAIADPHRVPVGTAIRMPVDRMRSQPRAIEVESVRGRAIGDAGALAAGARLAEGERVETAEDAFVTLRLADGSRVTVPSGSRVQVERSRSYGEATIAETILRLLLGRIDASVQKQGASDVFEVRSLRAVTGVRGTRFRVAALEADAVAAEVVEGRVAVAGENVAAAVDVAGGFGTKVETGREPLPPVRLLPAPGVGATPAKVERILVRLPFGAVEGARRYRAQVGLDAELPDIVSEGVFAGPEAKFADLPDGRYVLRVRAVDALGLEGLDAQHRFVLKARPEPPLIASPADRAKLAAAAAAAAWSSSTQAATYRLQVSASPDFAAPRIDERGLSVTQLDLGSRLDVGRWHWRIASVRADGDQGPWSDARAFTIIPEPPTPRAGKAEDGRLAFDWGGEPGQRFQFQLAADAAFVRVMVDRLLEEPKVAFEEPRIGEYFFRVRAIDPDGFQGPFSAPQRLEVSPSPWWLLVPLLIPLL